ncbi:LCP family protein [Senegalimassilia faecalis]|uniref:LCP family protein n=1 Tax=Senegalimassilia faecalis TaxID=2509433 RepID=UPI0030785AD9
MVRKRKDITQINSKLTSRRMRSATLGTHVPTSRPAHMNADQVGFSSPRRQKRAQRGYVSNVMPGATGPRSGGGYAGRLEFSPGQKRRTWGRRVGVAVAVVALLAAVAYGVWSFTLTGNLNDKLALKNSDAASALVAAKSGDPFYTLVVAELDTPGMPNSADGPDALALVRTDASGKNATIVSIPCDVQVSLKDGKYYPLREASVRESDASLVSAVANFADVSIAHVVKIDAAGLTQLVDALGGVDVTLPEEVDDPAAGSVYLPAGQQTLTGEGAVTLARATNFQQPRQTQAENQQLLLTAVAQRLVASGKSGLVGLLDQLNGAFQTDMSSNDALSLAESLKGLTPDAVQCGLVPGYVTQSDGQDVYAVSNSSWSTMMDRVDAGQAPAEAQQAATTDPGSFSITVRNGGGITGAAASMQQTLTSKGFNVTETGNTDTSVYNETLVIYNASDTEPAAQTVLNAMGVGRLVQNSGSYTFNTDVLVILGKDWKPAA